MHTILHDESTVTLNTGVIKTVRIKYPKSVVKLLHTLGVETMPPIQARRVFDNVCRFYKMKHKLPALLLQGQRIKHVVRYEGFSSTRIGTFQDGALLWDGNRYKSFSAFAQNHYKDTHPTRTTANGWTECIVLDHDTWISVSRLRHAYFKR